MSFNNRGILSKDIGKVLHIGADRGGELPQYKDIGVDEVVWIEANCKSSQDCRRSIGNFQKHLQKQLPHHFPSPEQQSW